MSDVQRRLFDTAPWEEDDQAEERVATVVFPGGPGGVFDYLVPDRLTSSVEAGRRVRVPLGRGNRTMLGYCVWVGSKRTGGRPRKPIAAVLDSRSLIGPPMLRVTQWIANHYLCPWGQVLEAVVPTGVRSQAGTRVERLLAIDPAALAHLAETKLSDAQARVIRVLSEAGEPLSAEELKRRAQCSSGPIAALKGKGLICVSPRRVMSRRPPEPTAARQGQHVLNPDQERALAAILAALAAREHQTILVHGVTGSGKTEIYIRAIQEVTGFGRQAIVLVPEISLTPQTLERFRARFDRVAVLHSHLSDVQRTRSGSGSPTDRFKSWWARGARCLPQRLIWA